MVCIQSIRFTALQDAFDKSLKDQAIFYRIYMKLFQAVLLIRAIKKQSRELHLYSPYFFALGMTNYS